MRKGRRVELLWEARVVVVWKVPEQPRIWSAAYWSVPPDPSMVREAVVSEETRRRVDDGSTEADGESETISVGGPLAIVGGCESEGVTFDEAVGRAGLTSETETALDTAGLKIFQFSNFSTTINFLLGFHTGQLFRRLS